MLMMSMIDNCRCLSQQFTLGYLEPVCNHVAEVKLKKRQNSTGRKCGKHDKYRNYYEVTQNLC